DEVARVNRYTMTGYTSTRLLIAAMQSCAEDLTWACTNKALAEGPAIETGVMAPAAFAGGRFTNSPVTIMQADYETLSYAPVD
ncbi:MAG: hypothetical protein ACU0DT_07995, partial [Albimonas sp.]|uniref:hypothetical protein n=1 Tax=Albimonas sp. TaxID=1872425 RepID=UPI0040566C9B